MLEAFKAFHVIPEIDLRESETKSNAVLPSCDPNRYTKFKFSGQKKSNFNNNTTWFWKRPNLKKLIDAFLSLKFYSQKKGGIDNSAADFLASRKALQLFLSIAMDF